MSFEYLFLLNVRCFFGGGMCCFGRRNELARIGCGDAKLTDIRYGQ